MPNMVAYKLLYMLLCYHEILLSIQHIQMFSDCPLINGVYVIPMLFTDILTNSGILHSHIDDSCNLNVTHKNISLIYPPNNSTAEFGLGDVGLGTMLVGWGLVPVLAEVPF